MSEVLSAVELWMVSYAVTARMPLAVYGAPNFGEILNCNDADFSLDEMCDAVESLFERRLISLGQYAPSTGMVEEASVGDVRAKLDEPFPGSASYVWLTQGGGEAWEAYVQPDWEVFILEEPDDASGTFHITSMSDRMLARYLDATCVAAGVDHLDTSQQPAGTWAATYWKTLTGGTRMTFRAPDERRFDPVVHSARTAKSALVRLWREIGMP